MKKSNKILLGMFLLAILFVLIGAFVKLNSTGGDIFLGIAIVLHIISIVGLLYINRAKLKSLLQ